MEKWFRFTELSLEAQKVAIQEFLVDAEAFGDGTEEWPKNEKEARRLLIEEDGRHYFDSKGVVIGGMY
jgi:hypothetical protein